MLQGGRKYGYDNKRKAKVTHLAFWGFFRIYSTLLTHGSQDDNDEVLSFPKILCDLLAEVTIGDLNIIFGATVISHQGEEIIIGNVKKLEFLAVNNGDLHVVSGGRQLFELLAGEDVEGSQVNLGVSVLSSFGGGHINDLARPALNDNVAVLPQRRALQGVGLRGTSIGALD